jgi:hypothetical protein
MQRCGSFQPRVASINRSMSLRYGSAPSSCPSRGLMSFSPHPPETASSHERY